MLSELDWVQVTLVVITVIIAVSAIASMIIMATTMRRFSRVLYPKYVFYPGAVDHVARIRMLADANQKLLETREGRDALVNFFVTESNISGFFSEIDDQVARAEHYEQLQGFLDEQIEGKSDPQGRLVRIKRGASQIAGKLFGKVNSLIKPYLGGGSEDE